MDDRWGHRGCHLHSCLAEAAHKPGTLLGEGAGSPCYPPANSSTPKNSPSEGVSEASTQIFMQGQALKAPPSPRPRLSRGLREKGTCIHPPGLPSLHGRLLSRTWMKPSEVGVNVRHPGPWSPEPSLVLGASAWIQPAARTVSQAPGWPGAQRPLLGCPARLGCGGTAPQFPSLHLGWLGLAKKAHMKETRWPCPPAPPVEALRGSKPGRAFPRLGQHHRGTAVLKVHPGPGFTR